MADPAIDVVIAVHTPERPIGRAVASVLDGSGECSRVTVVCHNVNAGAIAAKVAPAHRERVRYIEHHDGRRTPATPFNRGIEAATAPYVSIMGSDDQLEPGACASWLDLARRSRADAVITRLVRGDRRVPVPTPPTRPLRRTGLDGTRDRLSYRSAPLGLVTRNVLDRLGLRLDDEVAVGDDVPLVTRLWFESRVAYDRFGPAYVIGEDAGDRVTFTARPIDAELAFVHRLLRAPWFATYPAAAREAVATKLLRIHVFGVVLNRETDFWDDAERRALAGVTTALLVAVPDVARNLSLAEKDLLTAILDHSTDAHELRALAESRRRHGTPRTIRTPRSRDLLRRESPGRLMVASTLALLDRRLR